jgi:hypothetical protein
MRYINVEKLKELQVSLQIPKEIVKDAACKGADPLVMDGETIPNILAAREICAECPVRALCQDWAVWHEPAGVWAGMTPGERSKLRGGKPIIDIEERLAIINYAENLFSGKTVRQLAEEYTVTERTIYRWRSDLRELGLAG